MPRKSKEWGHPDGMSLSEVDEDALYDGVVTNVSLFGVFVDFGAVKDARLKVARKLARHYRRGMEVTGMSVVLCDPDSGSVVLEPDPDTLPDPPRDAPRRARSASRTRGASRSGSRGSRSGSRGASRGAGGKRAASRRAAARPARKWAHEEGTPLEALVVGDVFEGTVTNVSTYGVFVDIGAVRDARLNVPAKVGRCFRIGDIVENCTLESIELETQKMSAGLPDPEAAVRDLEPKERPPKARSKAKGQAKGKAKAKPKAKPKAVKSEEEGVIPIEELVIGSLCDGIVSAKIQTRVFVNIGCEKDALLQVPKRLASQFRKGDEVYGMRIETIDFEAKKIGVSIEDPELSVDGEELHQEEPPKRPAAVAKTTASAGTKPVAKTKPAAAPKPKAEARARPARAEQAAAAPAPRQAASEGRSKPPRMEHTNGLPLSRFRAGTHVNGTVTSITLRGVLVDIGAVTDALLQLPRHIAKQFQADDEVRGMTVEGVDDGGVRVLLSLDDPELEEMDEPDLPAPPARAGRQEPSSKVRATSIGGQAKAKPKAAPEPKAKPAATKAKTKAKAKASAKDWTHPGAMLIEDLEVGTELNGVVTNVGNFGIFVDVGAEKDGKLRLPRKLWRNYTPGVEVEGLIVEEVDVNAGSLWLRLASEEEPEGDHEEPPPPLVRKAPARKPAAGKLATGAGADRAAGVR